MRELILVHGRKQERKDPAMLKRVWITAWREGLAKSGLFVPIDVSAIRFPYYGDTLVEAKRAPETLDAADGELAFVAGILDEAREERGIRESEITVDPEDEFMELAPRNWRWVRALADALDEHLPGHAGGRALALVARDVYRYLHHPEVRTAVDDVVRADFSSGVEMVVVGYSLGSVVTYNLLAAEGEHAWDVPLYLTLGSPLGANLIRNVLEPVKRPASVGSWFNARDPEDIVAMHPLEAPWFRVEPRIENKNNVENDTDDQHGIDGYLDDPVVARRIYDALTRD